MTYKEQLKTPEWQSKRLEILTRDKFKCTVCKTSNNLHVHHKKYTRGKKAWEYDNDTLITLCEHHHRMEHGISEFKEVKIKVKKSANPFINRNVEELTVIEKETITTFIRKEETHCKVLSKTSEIKPVEVDSFAKVYHINRKYGLISNLSAQGCRMFLYLQMSLEQDQDWVKLPAEEVGKRLNLSLLTVRLGIKDLIDNGILCKRGKSDYWINPIVLFSGNRLQYFEATAPSKIKRVKDRNPRVLHVAAYDKQNNDVFI